MIFYGKQTLNQEDINAVVEVLKSDFLTCGPKIKEFEEKFAEYIESKYAIAVSSGTAALHLSCLAVDLAELDELITSPITFVASANCALYCGAKPVFADVDNNGLILVDKIKEKINSNTKIIIPVHYTGLPCDMSEIKKLADENNLIVIEDASHALGAKYKESKIGSCKYSDMTIFSFHPVKHITSGEGGMITTNSKKLYDKLILLRSHGITKSFENLINKNPEPWYHEMQVLGFNYRITDIQCALGISQLNKIDEFIHKRRQLAQRYDSAFQNNKNIELIKENNFQINVYHLYVIKVSDSKTRLALFNYLKEQNIICQVHYIPVYWQPYYEKLGYKRKLCVNAEAFYDRILTIPLYPALSFEDQDVIIEKINEFFDVN